MSWTDVIYPRNLEMKTTLAHLSGQLYILLESCFKAVNNLISCIEEYLPGQKFENIAVKTSQSLRDNCSLIMERVHEINAYLKTKAHDVGSRIDMTQFRQLMSLDTTIEDKIDIAKKALLQFEGNSLTAEGVMLIAMIEPREILTNLVRTLQSIAMSSLASLPVPVFGFAVDTSISASFGAVGNAFQEYTTAVGTFEPLSDAFYDDISMIIATVRFMHDV